MLREYSPSGEGRRFSALYSERVQLRGLKFSLVIFYPPLYCLFTSTTALNFKLCPFVSRPDTFLPLPHFTNHQSLFTMVYVYY
jgi:hypothetical protein